ncbi:helix-hairpin-helix domain-containing protein [Isobaculum melis]|uniref:Competence protein ComEA n=1 Tax=Isobaculum melis TaxID=142588 RepID=A0A1H9RX88_9LACT|nr:helix-hairpin-helix domain-containing protein [Isobaculum melis]SER76519.1 competence protein ComEA [Isobaculum melis]
MDVHQIIRYYQTYKKYLLIAGIVLGMIVLFLSQLSKKEQPVVQSNLTNLSEVSEEADAPEEIKSPQIFVDIKGAVLHPGIYEVLPESRVASLIELAGGLTEQADAKQINLAQQLQDEMVIYVPILGEEPMIQENEGALSQQKDSTKINLNKATLEELQKIPGVGQKKAEAILQYREEKGAFKKIEEITEISGIGSQTFEKLKEFIVVQ